MVSLLKLLNYLLESELVLKYKLTPLLSLLKCWVIINKKCSGLNRVINFKPKHIKTHLMTKGNTGRWNMYLRKKLNINKKV